MATSEHNEGFPVPERGPVVLTVLRGMLVIAFAILIFQPLPTP